MSNGATCSAVSLAVEEALAGTASEASRWLLVEVRGAWGRDAVVDSGLPDEVRAWLDAFPGKALLVRRPGRRLGVTVIEAIADESGGVATQQELDRLDDVAAADLGRSTRLDGPLVLVCAHGRRDACCARLGPPLYDALGSHLEPGRLWQASHLGGHRFAPNVLVLPFGVQLGRIPLDRAGEVAGLLASRRIPLDLYRGRTIYAPPVQAAEIAVRTATGCDGVGDLRLLAHAGERVTFSTPVGEVETVVEERPEILIPVSCGADPEPTGGWIASVV